MIVAMSSWIQRLGRKYSKTHEMEKRIGLIMIENIALFQLSSFINCSIDKLCSSCSVNEIIESTVDDPTHSLKIS